MIDQCEIFHSQNVAAFTLATTMQAVTTTTIALTPTFTTSVVSSLENVATSQAIYLQQQLSSTVGNDGNETAAAQNRVVMLASSNLLR